MMVPSKRYSIYINATGPNDVYDKYFLGSETGTWEANAYLRKLGFDNFNSVWYYQKHGKKLPVPSGLTLPYLSEPATVDYLKGLVHWSQIDRVGDNHFNQSPIKQQAIAEGAKKYTEVFLTIE